MKKYLLVIVMGLLCNCLQAQMLSGNSVLWEPGTSDARVLFKFYTKGIMIGKVESGELLIDNKTSHKLFVKVKYVLTDYCGNSTREYSKEEVLQPESRSKSAGAFFSGIDYETDCKEKRKYSDNISSMISRVAVYIESIEDLTAKEEEQNRKKEEEEERIKAAEVKKKKEAEEKKIEAEKKQKREEEDRKIKDEEMQTAKKEAEQKLEKELAEKENAAKQIEDETERKAALEKVENEKIAAEKKVKEKKAAEKQGAEKNPLEEEEQKAMWERNGRASKLEADGDELVYKDASAAKRLYEQAQLINYTNRVAEKIKNLKTNLQVQAGFQAIQGVDKLTEELDPKGKTRFYEMFSGYDGFASNNDKLNKQYQSDPWQLHAFGFRMSAIFLAAELRMGYYNSPYYQFEVRNTKDVDRNIDNVGIQHQSISIGLSGGLNIPIKNFCIYGLYGVEWLGGVTAKNIQEGKGYSFDDDDYPPKFPDIIFVLSSGIDFRIPKTRIGIGVRYNVNNVQIKPRDANIKLKGGVDTRYQYFMNRISPEKVEYSNLGFRMIWKWDN